MKHILLIDDDPIIYDLATRILARLGYQVIWAMNGSMALKILNESDSLPDLVLCDLMMPDMNGYETLKAIRANPRLSGLPIVMLTGQSKASDLKLVEDHNLIGYIIKPFGALEFMDQINKFLNLIAGEAANGPQSSGQ